MGTSRFTFVDLFLLLGISLAWAAGYLFIGAAARGAPPITATAGMTVVAALVMVPGVAVLGRPLLRTLRRRPWVPIVMGLSAIALPNLAVVAAERSVPPDLAALLGTSVPIFTLLLTTFVTRETRFSLLRMLGVAVALGGLVVFVGWSELLGDAAELHGILLMVSGGFVFALNGIFVARQTEDLDEVALATWTILFGAVGLTAAAFVFERPFAGSYGAGVLWSLAAEGVVGMGLAYLGYYVLVARAGAYFASLYAFLVPPLGVLASALVLGEAPTARHLLGLAIVLAGLFLLTGGRRAG